MLARRAAVSLPPPKQREKRLARNAILKRRLVEDLTKPRLKEMFAQTLSYLEDIKAGRRQSERHDAFHTNAGSRQALLHQMITHPFSDAQVDWTYDEMKEVWIKNSKEYHDNNDYIWKVLMPECFIKFYMDFFNMARAEAEACIRETPHDEEY